MPEYEFKFDNQIIEIVKEFTYLGVFFSRGGSFIKTIKRNVNKGTQAMYEILRKGRLHNLSVSCQYDLFHKIVTPILLYGCEIWGHVNTDLIERLHLKFCELLLCLKKSTPNFMVYGELGAYPLDIYIKCRMLGYWAKLLSQNNDRLSKIMYNLMYSKYLMNDYNSKWLLFIKHTLDSLGYGNVFMFQNTFSKNWLHETLKRRLFDQFQQAWLSNLSDSPKGLNYRIFKESFGFEKYLDKLTTKDRITFCRFRTCNHKLPIETGRWINVERNERKCIFCDKNDIGDEFHYILVCPY